MFQGRSDSQSCSNKKSCGNEYDKPKKKGVKISTIGEDTCLGRPCNKSTDKTFTKDESSCFGKSQKSMDKTPKEDNSCNVKSRKPVDNEYIASI